jgi:hypothetical protein
MNNINTVFEHWLYHTGFNDTLEINGDGQYTDSTVNSLFCAFSAAWDTQQATIDRLMLEYCPDEMSSEQVNEWANHQVPFDDRKNQ